MSATWKSGTLRSIERDPVATTDAEPPQTSGEPTGPIGVLLPGQLVPPTGGFVAAAQRDVVRLGRDPVGEAAGDGLARHLGVDLGSDGGDLGCAHGHDATQAGMRCRGARPHC